ncbi:MAG: triose-phosphate isomerase [Bdellovibrionales bacterium]
MSVQFVAGNWKLNKGPKEALEFLYEFKEIVPENKLNQFILFLPALTLGAVAKSLAETELGWGGQNVFFEDEGAFTGENSAAVLRELGASYCLVGHSERRQIFGETDDWMAKKVALLQNHQIIPMLCVGETLEQRKAGQTIEVITNQLRAGLKEADLSGQLAFAYEPVWAIGTGEVATPEMAEEAHAALRTELKKLSGTSGTDFPILYGGSVKPENSKELSVQPNIDGFLVGGASLKPQSFFDIYKNC